MQEKIEGWYKIWNRENLILTLKSAEWTWKFQFPANLSIVLSSFFVAEELKKREERIVRRFYDLLFAFEPIFSLNPHHARGPPKAGAIRMSVFI